MAVITPKDIVACATAAGPAFEGANIKFGMGAFEGAISEYAANACITIANKPAIGICGSGLLDVLAFLLHENHLSSDGLLPDDYVLVPESKAGVDTAICITPQDIREVQLAKSAIRTGINILLKEAGLNYADLDSVYLAGGFGNYMKPESAIAIGLIPHDDKVPIVPVGNTSGAGAVMHVVDPVFTDKLQLTLNRMKTIDLSTHPDFELEFAMNMYF